MMKTVKVTGGHIICDSQRYDVGDVLEVPEEQAQNWERIGVAKIIPQSNQEEQPVVEVTEAASVAETTEQPAGPEMIVDEMPFEKPRKKRGRRKKG